MIDPEDLLVHHGLRELLGDGDVDGGDDLAHRVREAWERGERRPLPELDGDAAPAAGPRPLRGPRPSRVSAARAGGARRQKPWPRVAAVAGLLVSAGLALWWAPWRDATPAVPAPGPMGPSSPSDDVLVATADRALRLPSDELTDRLEPGMVAFVPAGAPMTLRTPEGAALRPSVGSRLALEESGAVALLAGELSAIGGEAPARVELSGGVTVEIPQGAGGRVAVFEALERRDDAEPFVGAVRLAPDGAPWKLSLGGPEALAVAAPAVVLLDGGPPRLATEEDAAVAEEVAFLGKPIAPRAHNEVLQGAYREGVLALLREKPELWALASDAMAAVLTGEETPDYAKRQLLGSLGADPGAAATALVRLAWREAPDLVPLPTIVAMAERGVPEFEREVDAWLEHWDPSAGDAPFAVALHLALRGDDRGARILEDTIPDAGLEGLRVVTAAGLARVGNLVAFEDAVAAHAEETRRRIADGEIESASMLVDALAYAMALAEGTAFEGSAVRRLRRAPLPSAPIVHWAAVHHAERLEQPRGPAELEAELAALLGE